MNDHQRKLLLCAAIVLIVMVLYPPFVFKGDEGAMLNMGYSWLMFPPKIGNYSTIIATVNVPLLITQELVAAVAFAGVYFYQGRK